MSSTKHENIPQHIAIIMDGNGRWAEKRHWPRTRGHLEGVKRVEEIVEAAYRMGVKILTLYTFSTENWRRPQVEVSMLMNTLMTVLKQKVEKFKKNNIRFQVIGRKESVPEPVLRSINFVTNETEKNTGMILNMAFNYGSRQEIVDAVRQIAALIRKGKLNPDEIQEETISQALYTQGIPDPDLLIRTSGELRISNFLLWQLSYAEFYFTEKYWPDFDIKEFEKAIIDYQQRERRYGAV